MVECLVELLECLFESVVTTDLCDTIQSCRWIFGIETGCPLNQQLASLMGVIYIAGIQQLVFNGVAVRNGIGSGERGHWGGSIVAVLPSKEKQCCEPKQGKQQGAPEPG